MVFDGPLDYYVYKARVNQISLPPDTTVLDKQEAFGLVAGNGNHCDYVVRWLVRTKLNQKQLEANFASRTVPAPNDTYEGLTKIEASIYRPEDFSTRGDPERWAGYANDPHVFVVEYFASRDPGLDMRCN
jgi:hypothetical protein